MTVLRTETRCDDAGPNEALAVRRADLVSTPISLNRGAYIDEKTGFLHAEVRPTRTGVFRYVRADGSISNELKHPDDVFEPASLETLKRLVVTRGHPRRDDGRPYDVTADNVAALQVGHGGDTIDRVKVDGEEHPKFGVTVTRREVARSIVGADNKPKRDQVSLGYTTVLVPESGVYKGQPYNARHTQIRYNHLAVDLDAGRGGKTVNFVLDEADAVDEALIAAERREDEEMNEIEINGVKIKVDGAAAAKLIMDAIAAGEAKADAADKAKKTVEAERDALQAKVDARTKADEEAKKKQDEAPSFGKRFRELQALRTKAVMVIGKVDDEAKAKVIVDALDKAIDDANPEAALRRAALVARGDALDGKSEAYVDALFDIRIRDAEAAAKAEAEKQGKQDSTQELGVLLLKGAGAPTPPESKADEALKKALTNTDPVASLAKSGAKGVMTHGAA